MLTLSQARKEEKRKKGVSDDTSSSNNEIKTLADFRKEEQNNTQYDAAGWFQAANNLMKEVEQGSQNPQFEFAQNASGYSERLDNLNQDRYINEYVESLKGTAQYKPLKNQLTQYKRSLSGLADYTKNLGAFASNYDNEDDYNRAVTDINRSQKYATLRTYDDFLKAIDETDDEDEKNWLKNKSESVATYADIEKQYNELKNKDVTPENHLPKNYHEGTGFSQEEEEKNSELERLEALKNKKYADENIEKYYTNLDPKVAQILDKYYYVTKNNDKITEVNPDEAAPLSKDEQFNESLRNDYNAVSKEATADFESLFDEGYDIEELFKWYSRGKERADSEEYQKEQNELVTQNVGAEIAGSLGTVVAHPIAGLDTARKYLSAEADKVFNGGDGFLDPETTSIEGVTQTRKAISEKVGENSPELPLIGNVSSFLYDTGMSMADFLALMPLNAVPGGQAVSLGIMSTEAGTQSANDALKNGSSLEQALATGVASGIAEAFFEKFSIEQLKAFKQSGSSSVKDIVTNTLKGMATEGSEEAFTDVANLISDNIINGDISQLSQSKKEYIKQGYSEDEAERKAWQDFGTQVVQSFSGGALSGGALNLGAAGVNYTSNIIDGSEIKSNSNADTLIRIAQQYQNDENVKKLTQKLEKSKGKDYSSSKLGQLRRGVMSTAAEGVESDNTTAIKNYVKNSSLTAEEKSVANKFLTGQRLTQSEADTINNSKSLRSLVSTMPEIDSKHTQNYLSALSSVKFTLPKSEVIDYNKVDTDGMTTQNALKASAEAQGFNADTTKAFISNYDGDLDVDQYTQEFLQYHNIGRTLSPMDTLNNSVYSLSDKAKIAAYNSGKNVYVSNAKATYALTEAQKQWKADHKGYTEGTVDTSEIENTELSTHQQEQIEYISAFAKGGINIKFYESKPNAEGKYTDANGYYDSFSNTVAIDINAGRTNINQAVKQAAMMSTFSHELTHISEHAPEEYSTLRESIANTLGDKAWNDYVQKQIDNQKNNHSERYNSMSDDEVHEYASKEALAEVCSDMLRHSDILEKMASENPSTAKKLIEVVKKVINRLRELHKRIFNSGYSPFVKNESRTLLAQADGLQALVDKWEKAVVEGIKNQNASMTVEGNTEQSSNVQNELRNIPDEKTINNNIEYVANMEPVAVLSGEEFKKSDIDLVTQVLTLYSDKYGGFVNTDYGKVEFTKSGIKSSIHHGVGRNKATAFMAVPNVLRSGKIIDYQHNWKSRGYDTAVISAPIILNNNKYFMGVVVKATQNNGNKYYLHEVLLQKNRDEFAFKNGSEDQKTVTKPSPIISLLQKLQISNNNSAQNSLDSSVRNQDRDYLTAVENNDLETAQRMVNEAAKSNGYVAKLMYHGTPNGFFNVFNKWQYFTDSKEYADVYQNQGASSNGYKKTADKPYTYTVYLRYKNAFDTRKLKHRNIFYNEFYRKWGNGAPLSDKGLPDWTDGDDLIEFFEENGYKFDAIILDEGSVGGYGDEVISRGISVVVKNSNQIKSADAVTYDDNGEVISLSERFKDSSPDIRYQDREEVYTEDDLLEESANGDFDLDVFDEDLFEDEEIVDFDNMLKDDPQGAMELMFNSLAKQSHEIVRSGKIQSLSDSRYRAIANKLVKDYSIERSHIGDLTNKIKNFVKNASEENFSDSFKEFVLDMHQSLLYSNVLDDERAQRRKDVRNIVKGRTLIIPAAEEGEIRSNYEDIRTYKNKLLGYGITVALEKNAQTGIDGNKKGTTVKDIITDLQQIGELTSLGEDIDGGNAFITLEKFLNDTLAPKYINPYLDGLLENIDVAAVELASDAMTEYAHQLGLNSTSGGYTQKEVNALKRQLSRAQEQRDNLLRATKANTKLTNELNTYKQRLDKLREDSYKLDEVNWLIESNYDDETLLEQRAELEKLVDDDSKELLKLKSTKPIKNLVDRKVQKVVAKERSKQRNIINQLKEQKHKNQSLKKEWREARELTDVVDRIRKLQSKMSSALRHPTANAYVPDAFATAYIEACTAITEALENGKMTKANINLKTLLIELDKLNKSDTEYNGEVSEQLRESLEYVIEMVGLLDKQLQELDGKPLNTKNISLSQANLIYTLMYDIYNTVQDATKQLAREDIQTNFESGEALNRDFNVAEKFAKKAKLKEFKNLALNGIRLARYYSGYNENSEIMYHVNALNEGQRKANQYKMEAEKMFLKLTESRAKEYKRSLEETVNVEYKLDNGEVRSLSMNRMTALQILMTWSREQSSTNLVHMEKSGFLLPDAELLKKGKIAEAIENSTRIEKVNVPLVSALESILTDFELEYRKIAEKYFNEFSKNAINDVSNIIKHRSIAMAEYYIPIVVDKNYLQTELEELNFDRTLEGMGMLKSTVRKAPQPIVITSLNSVIARHINDVSKFYGLAVPTRNFKKALNINFRNEDGGKSGSVRDTINKVWGADANKFFNRLIADLESSRSTDNDASNRINNAIRSLRSAMVVKTLTANISVVIKQAASYPTAGVYLSRSSLMKGLGVSPALFKPGNYQKLINEIDEHTAQHYMRRIGLSQQEIAELMNSWVQKIPTALNPAKWIQGVDCITTALLWNACKYEIKRSGVAESSQDFYEKVTDLYDKVIEDTQPMYDSLHRTELQKNTSEVWKSVFMFKTQPLQNTGIVYDSLGDAIAHPKDKTKRNTAIKAVSSQIVSLTVFAGMSALAAAALNKSKRYKDDDEEVTTQSVLNTIFGDMLTNGVGVAVPIFGNELYEAIKSTVEQKGRYDTFTMPFLDMLNDTVSTTQETYDEVVNMIDSAQYGLISPQSILSSLNNLVVQISGFKGIPTQNIENIINGITSRFGFDFLNKPTERTAKSYVESYARHYSGGDINGAKEQLDTLYQQKYNECIEKGDSLSDALKKAKTYVRTSLSTAFKTEYQKAFLREDTARMNEITNLLSKSGYMVYQDKFLSEVLWDWRQDAETDVQKNLK